MTFDNTLPHALPWNYPWIKDEIERRDEYIAQLEAELARQKPQNDDSGAIECETVKVPAQDESGAHSEPDSREKLLGDLERLTQTWHDYDGNFMRVYGGVAYAQVKELLDRQASITEREFMEIREDLTADNLWMHERIAEVTAEREKLTAEHERIVQEMVDANTRQCERTNELTAERDEWKAKAEENSHGWAKANAGWAEANAEAEVWRQRCDEWEKRYSAALGKAIDCADEIRRLS